MIEQRAEDRGRGDVPEEVRDEHRERHGLAHDLEHFRAGRIEAQDSEAQGMARVCQRWRGRSDAALTWGLSSSPTDQSIAEFTGPCGAR